MKPLESSVAVVAGATSQGKDFLPRVAAKFGVGMATDCTEFKAAGGAFTVRRPVFATMLIMTMIVLGLFAYNRLIVERFPRVEFPIVTITTRFPGASIRFVSTAMSYSACIVIEAK